MYRYYICIYGYGTESCWNNLSPEAFQFWKNNKKLLRKHILQNYKEIPEYAKLLKNPPNYPYLWHQMDNINHEYYIPFEYAKIRIDQIDENNNLVKNLYYNQYVIDLSEEYYMHNSIFDKEETNEKYGIQIYTKETGNFWECFFNSNKPFDIGKLKFNLQLAMNNQEYIICDVLYDNKMLHNDAREKIETNININLIEF